jgi:hypothetical protein
MFSLTIFFEREAGSMGITSNKDGDMNGHDHEGEKY